MKHSPIKFFHVLKGLCLSCFFLFISDSALGQTIADKKPYEAPLHPSSVKPVEQKVTITRTGEKMVSKSTSTNPKYIQGKAEEVFISEEKKAGKVLLPASKGGDENATKELPLIDADPK